MSVPARDWVSVEEYIARENAAETKSEYFNGEIYAMSGGRPEHSQAAAEFIALLVVGLRGTGCRVYTSDLRLVTPRSGLRTYPDAAVVCGPFEMDELDPIAVVNPSLILEVVSDSSEAYDRNDKFAFYSEFPTLKEYVLIYNAPQRIETWSRSHPNEEWSHAESTPPDGRLTIPSFGIEVEVGAIFAEIEIAPRRPKNPTLKNRRFRPR
jgi:Uma2 family endonuclease